MPAGSVEGDLFISSTSLGPTKARAEKAIAVGAAESIARERSKRCFVRVEFRELVEKRKFCDKKCGDVGDLLLLLLLLLKRSDERVKALNIYEPGASQNNCFFPSWAVICSYLRHFPY